MKITGGRAKGRQIKTPPGGKYTRPTSAIVREAIFGMLGEKILNAVCLDLFCGSGALSLEALSRGAEHTTMIDKDGKAARTARENAQLLGFKNYEVYRNDSLRALKILEKKQKKFDIVFVDPPYYESLYGKVLDAAQSILAHGAIIVCEHDIKNDIVTNRYEKIKTNKYGKRAVTLFKGG